MVLGLLLAGCDFFVEIRVERFNFREEVGPQKGFRLTILLHFDPLLSFLHRDLGSGSPANLLFNQCLIPKPKFLTNFDELELKICFNLLV